MKKQNFERIIGKTVSGGKYSDIYYFCGYNQACAKKDATYCTIYEKNSKGKVINTIHCKL